MTNHTSWPQSGISFHFNTISSVGINKTYNVYDSIWSRIFTDIVTDTSSVSSTRSFLDCTSPCMHDDNGTNVNKACSTQTRRKHELSNGSIIISLKYKKSESLNDIISTLCVFRINLKCLFQICKVNYDNHCRGNPLSDPQYCKVDDHENFLLNFRFTQKRDQNRFIRGIQLILTVNFISSCFKCISLVSLLVMSVCHIEQSFKPMTFLTPLSKLEIACTKVGYQ